MVLIPTIRLGDEIDIVNRTVRAGELRLSPLELGLLYLLAANPGRVLTRKEILETLWGMDHPAETRLGEQYVRHLRARLQQGGGEATEHHRHDDGARRTRS